MADTKISALTALAGASVDVADLLPIVDTDVATTKKITAAELVIALKALGLAGLGANIFTALQTITQASANAGILAATGYSLTAANAQSMLSLAGTLNTTGSPDVVKIAITDTARGAATKLLNLYAGAAGATSVFAIDRVGTMVIPSGSRTVLNAISQDSTTGWWLTSSGGVGGVGIFYGGYSIFADASVGWKNPRGAYFSWCDHATQAESGTADTFIARGGAAATIQFGLAAGASPVSQTVQVQGSRPGTDTNIGGGSLTIQSGNGTGTGTVSTLALKSPVAVASGTGAQTQTAGLTIKVGTAVLTSYTVANLPAAATAGAGATAFVTDASTTLILGLGTTVTGGGANKTPVHSDGTNWIYG